MDEKNSLTSSRIPLLKECLALSTTTRIYMKIRFTLT